jgi:AcrR family transcriptional regulator
MSTTSPGARAEAAPYELVGRSRQKLRTQKALIDAARKLVTEGLAPTVEEAAAAAGISRTTAYRYFTSQSALLAAAHPEIERTSLLPERPPASPEARLEIVISELTRILLDSEPQQRTMLRLSLEAGAEPKDLVLRKGRAIGWIEEALEPLRGRLSPKKLRRLALAIRSAVGIEPLVWLTDVAGLTRKEAVSVMRWSASSLLVAALAESAGKRPRMSPRIQE